MKTITMTAIVLVALATGTVATISSSSASRALAGSEDLTQPALTHTAIPVFQMMASAANLPSQSFDAF